MACVTLEVPFCDKDEVKRLGGRWDAVARTWYVPDGLDAASFGRWIPEPAELNVQAGSYFIAESTHECWKCARATRVHGFVLPAGHALLNVGEVEEEDEWEIGDEPTLLCFIEHLTPEVTQRIRAITLSYRCGYSRNGGALYWMNFCEHCGAGLDDNEVFCEPGMGFLAFTEEDARRVTLRTVTESFGATAGSYSYGVALFDDMRVV